MKNMRSVLSTMESYSCSVDDGKAVVGKEANGSGVVESCAAETNGTDDASVGVSAAESQSSAIEGNGLLANGVTGCSVLEKSNAGGCDNGLSSNHTSLYI